MSYLASQTFDPFNPDGVGPPNTTGAFIPQGRDPRRRHDKAWPASVPNASGPRTLLRSLVLATHLSACTNMTHVSPGELTRLSGHGPLAEHPLLVRDRDGEVNEIEGDFKYARIVDRKERIIHVMRPPFIARIVDESLFVRTRGTDWKRLPLERIERIEIVERRRWVLVTVIAGSISVVLVGMTLGASP